MKDKPIKISKTRDRIGEILGIVPVRIDVSALELWMVRILLWAVYIKIIINTFS